MESGYEEEDNMQYDFRKIRQALQGIPVESLSTEEIIKAALKHMVK